MMMMIWVWRGEERRGKEGKEVDGVGPKGYGASMCARSMDIGGVEGRTGGREEGRLILVYW